MPFLQGGVGIRVTPALLTRIDRAEREVRGLGYAGVRVRHFGERAVVEVQRDDVARLIADPRLGWLTDRMLELGWTEVSIDPIGYRPGRMNEYLPPALATRQTARRGWWSARIGEIVGINERAMGPAAQQELVDRHFQAAAKEWEAIYRQATVYGVIHQERSATALHWIDGLGLTLGAPVLEIGCGAGLTSVALAERNYDVMATDTVPVMIRLTEQRARDRDLAGRIHTRVADAHSLPFPDCSYSLVLALGVLPWLHSPALAVREMARVLRPGGFMLVNVDNVFRLHYWLDVRLNPALAPVRDSVRAWLRRLGVIRTPAAPIPVRLESPRRFDATLARAGLRRTRGTTLGFGPFTFWNRPILSEEVGVQLHLKLKNLADHNVPLIRNVGAQYLVLAYKASREVDPSSSGAREQAEPSEVA